MLLLQASLLVGSFGLGSLLDIDDLQLRTVGILSADKQVRVIVLRMSVLFRLFLHIFSHRLRDHLLLVGDLKLLDILAVDHPDQAHILRGVFVGQDEVDLI